MGLYAVFHNQDGIIIKRPAFWNGDNEWIIRFTSPDDHSLWTWTTYSSNKESDLHNLNGKIQAFPSGTKSHGLLRMSTGKRNVEYHDGTSFLIIGDTPWAIPFRATTAQVKYYATDRKKKGFNTALLMSLQPDMHAVGPNERDTDQGFASAFEDLSEGHINIMNPVYFLYLDSLISILHNYDIVPVFQPVFHGFGWEGLDVLGNIIVPEEYVRYCRYLLARYGDRPAIWLLAGDNGGRDPGVKESGKMMEEWDSYEQPTGLHYNPCDDFIALWAVNNPVKHCEHYNKTFQSEEWLDFQWAQTGHSNEHQYHKVERMYENLPIKASANGEPTYEGMGDGKLGLGWWQGEDAWMQLMSGGTMGVVYGAASLWQWKFHPEEEGWNAWASQPMSWKEALDMEGSNYVGYISKAFSGYDISDMERRWDLSVEGHPLLAKEESFYISYLNEGGTITIKGIPAGLFYRWFDPKTGKDQRSGVSESDGTFVSPSSQPWVLIIGHR
ncbi:MAG: hypothetical protein ACI9FN_003438 [Saprospiraceae bacterium]